MASRENFLIVGAGMMGSIFPPLIRQAGGEVVGVMGISDAEINQFLDTQRLPFLNRAYVDKFMTDNGDFTFEAYERILSTSQVDDGMAPNCVAILMPNNMHAKMGIMAANAGKHILIEKPLATTSQDAQAFLDAVLANGVVAEIDSLYRHHELLDITLRNIIESTELGNPTCIKMNYLQGWQIDPYAAIGWRPVVAIAGKGKLVGDLGAHVIQATLELFGGEFVDFEGKTYNTIPVRYKFIGAQGKTFETTSRPTFEQSPESYEVMDMLSGKYSGDDNATADFVLRTSKGVNVPGHYNLSQVAAGHANDFTIDVEFQKGRVYWEQEHPNQLLYTGPDGRVVTVERHSNPSATGRPSGHPHGYGDAIHIELRKMFDVIESGDADRIRAYSQKNIGDAVTSVKMIEKWNESPLICNN